QCFCLYQLIKCMLPFPMHSALAFTSFTSFTSFAATASYTIAPSRIFAFRQNFRACHLRFRRPAAPFPASLFASYPEQANTLSLLYEVSREITSILDREELLRRVAQRVKKLVNYHVFSVMLWNEKTQYLESAFVMRYGDSIPPRTRIPLHQGLTGAAASAPRVLRVNDTLEDP